MRVLIDSNVFVSSLLRASAGSSVRASSSRIILEAFRDGAFTLITSTAIVEELVEVLNRPKFAESISGEDARNLLELIEAEAVFVNPKPTTLPVRDPDDRAVLACLYAAEILITGDHDLQALSGAVASVRILSPAAFIPLLRR